MHTFVFRCVALLFLGGVACVGARPPKDARVVELHDLAASRDADDFVVFFPAGTVLPVAVAIETPWATAAHDRAFDVTFARDVYWSPRRPHWISWDGVAWERWDRTFRGRLQVGLAQSPGDGATRGNVSVTLMPR